MITSDCIILAWVAREATCRKNACSFPKRQVLGHSSKYTIDDGCPSAPISCNHNLYLIRALQALTLIIGRIFHPLH